MNNSQYGHRLYMPQMVNPLHAIRFHETNLGRERPSLNEQAGKAIRAGSRQRSFKNKLTAVLPHHSVQQHDRPGEYSPRIRLTLAQVSFGWELGTQFEPSVPPSHLSSEAVHNLRRDSRSNVSTEFCRRPKLPASKRAGEGGGERAEKQLCRDHRQLSAVV